MWEGDYSTGLNFYVGMVFAVLRQRATALGSVVDCSLYASGIWAAIPHMLEGETHTDGGDLLLCTVDRGFLGTRSTVEKVRLALGRDPVKMAAQMDMRQLTARLDACGVEYVSGVQTQSLHQHELHPEVRSVVLPASSAVGDVTWDAPFPFGFEGFIMGLCYIFCFGFESLAFLRLGLGDRERVRDGVRVSSLDTRITTRSTWLHGSSHGHVFSFYGAVIV